MGATPNLRAVFLDAGGTLLVETPSRAEIYRGAARARGYELDLEHMAASMRAAHDALPREVEGAFRYSERWFRALIARVFGRDLGMPAGAVADVEQELFARFADPATFRLLPGALELVRELDRRGLTVAVVSNWSERLPAILEGLGLARWLDFVVVSAVERCEKPEREIFERALARAAVGPDQALHAGDDRERDVQGARAVGILPVFVDRHALHPEVPCARVVDLFELRRWITERIETT